MATYRPKFVKQLDGSWYGGLNCMCASGAMDLDRDTLGVKHTTGAHVRLLTGAGARGVTLGEVDGALRVGYPPSDHLDVRNMLPWDDFIDFVSAGRGAILQGGYGAFKGHTSAIGDRNFVNQTNSNHGIYINEVRKGADGKLEFLKYDPLCDGRGTYPQDPTWITEQLLQNYAADLLLGNGNRVGQSHCYAGFTRDTVPSGPPPPPVKPPLHIDYGRNTMIVSAGLVLTSTHVMALKKGTKLYRSPSLTGGVVTKMSKDAKVRYFGNAGGGYRMVQVSTANFTDHVLRPVLVYVPGTAGPISSI